MAVTYTTQAATDGMLYSNKIATALILGAIEDGVILIGHPAITMADDVMGPNWHVGLTPGGTITFPIDMAAPDMTSSDETTDVVAPTTIDLTNVTMSTGLYDISYEVSNELRRRDQHGRYQVVPIAQSITRSAGYTATKLVVALAPSATTTVGTTGTPLTWDVISDGAESIRASGKNQAVGDIVCILHPAQWRQVKADLASTTGARAERREFDQFQAAVMTGYQGKIDNIEIWTCDKVTESTGDYSGLMFCTGGVGMAIVPPAEAFPGQEIVLDTPLVQVSASYDAANKSGKLIGDMTIGVAILRQALVREVLSTGNAT
jgi:hypothetical protein